MVKKDEVMDGSKAYSFYRGRKDKRILAKVHNHG